MFSVVQNTIGFQLYGSIKVPAMKSKVLEFNTALTESKVRVHLYLICQPLCFLQNEFAMNESDLKTFERLCVNLGDSANYHAAPFSQAEHNVLVLCVSACLICCCSLRS
jgi:hypothetical protein